MLEENKQSRHSVVLSSKSGWLLLREVLALLGEGDSYFLKSPPVIHGLHRKLPYNLLPVTAGQQQPSGKFLQYFGMWETPWVVFPKAL